MRPLVIVITLCVLWGCESKKEKEARLVETFCGNCHLAPKPDLLPRKIWKESILPRMGARLGFDAQMLMQDIPVPDLEKIIAMLPAKPIVDEAEWEIIQNYYVGNAPDSLMLNATTQPDSLRIFSSLPVATTGNRMPGVAAVFFDSISSLLVTASRHNLLESVTPSGRWLSQRSIESPISCIRRLPNGYLVTNMGIMDPNDQAAGGLVFHQLDFKAEEMRIGALQRPVFFEEVDLNSDGEHEFLICEFGHFTGALNLYKPQGKGFSKQTLSSLPGARKTEVRDFTADGRPDIVVLFTQGDEQITLFENQGNFEFVPRVLLRFPPVYGSSYFETTDFNKDGLWDLVYTNGDNADYSIIVKPYHGVRIFLQGAEMKFSETQFYPMPGASQTVATDFDSDGDIDIAAISFFPDYREKINRGFVYLENVHGTFRAATSTATAGGRWISLLGADIDRDGDRDLVLGALDFRAGVPQPLFEEWASNRTMLLVLRNNTHN